MLPGIGRLGAGTCTVRVLSRTDRVHPLTFATAAGLLDAGDLDHFELRCDHIEQLADILSNDPQITAAIAARGTGIKRAALTRVVSETRGRRRGLFLL